MSISDDQLKQICQRALTVRERAFAPYSNFLVGSALLSTSGQIYVGCNVENVSYGLTLCAERSAIAAMVACGEQKAVAIAIASQGGVTPCGACRQVLSEFGLNMQVFLLDSLNPHDYECVRLQDLLPRAFNSTALD